ncbi:MAG: UDP-3-O-acyl-N-acetylglucosamine deacetylase [Alphaproteobacteria bacterium]
MASIRQKTLKTSISCTGIGLHSGHDVAMTLHPADAGAGISFHRTDVPAHDADIPASWRSVVDTRMATTLGNQAGTRISTVEHLMAALAGCGIDNAVIDVDGPEVPVMDGSAAPFIFLIECAGVVEQGAPRRAIRIDSPISVGDEKRFISARPDESFNISFEIDFANAAVASQSLTMRLVNGTFKTEIARARTFGFADEVDALREAGLARGGSLDNAVVISGNKVLNGDGLRYSDEFVRHKILDCVGDLYLAGGPIIGRIDALRSGHSLNHHLLRELFANDEAWSWVELTDMVVPGATFGWEPEAQVAIA